jgi:hypothetical protein
MVRQSTGQQTPDMRLDHRIFVTDPTTTEATATATLHFLHPSVSDDCWSSPLRYTH